MRWWSGSDPVPVDWERSVAAIGVFDGVHAGHRRIIERVVDRAGRTDAAAIVVTFDPHPTAVVRPDAPYPAVLTPVPRRGELIADLGVDVFRVLPFTREFSQLGPEEFVRAVLVDQLRAAGVVVGENFRFGHRAAGDVATLTALGHRYGFDTEPVPLAGAGGPVSSTAIRCQIASGDVADAAAGLGRPHQVDGVVVRGAMRGRALGFPTANLDVDPRVAVPADGVYAGYAVLLDRPGDAPRPAAASVGTNPTFDGTERTVEAHLLDFDGDLYGRRLGLRFVRRLRAMERFDTTADLVATMRRDVELARATLG